MSQIDTIHGVVDYPNQTAMNRALDVLRDGGWLTPSDDSAKETLQGGYDLSRVLSGTTLELPAETYRNLSRHLDRLVDPADSYHIVVTTHDGHFAGEVKSSVTGDFHVNLDEWAGERETVPAEPDDLEKRVSWGTEVEAEFRELHGPRAVDEAPTLEKSPSPAHTTTE